MSVRKSVQIMMDLDFEQPVSELHLTSITLINLDRCCHGENEKTASVLNFPVAPHGV